MYDCPLLRDESSGEILLAGDEWDIACRTAATQLGAVCTAKSLRPRQEAVWLLSFPSKPLSNAYDCRSHRWSSDWEESGSCDA
jgi:hypothetical protein